MATSAELHPEDFFASRSGVCVYVTLRGQTFRVQFASADAHGVVTEGTSPEAAAALDLAKAALQKHQAALAPLFEKVSRGTT
ncbi:MAG TPA: hypothetical protein VJN18_21070 [Polyangiaceae bacterium]|nr:hypothetical protein [Polyangiaceae bacterium]